MKFTTIRPLYDRVLVKRSEADKTTAGGIIIPENAKEKPVRGEVLAVGIGKLLKDGTTRPLEVKPGDVVLFGKWSPTEVEIDGEQLVIVREEDLLGVFDLSSEPSFVGGTQ